MPASNELLATAISTAAGAFVFFFGSIKPTDEEAQWRQLANRDGKWNFVYGMQM